MGKKTRKKRNSAPEHPLQPTADYARELANRMHLTDWSIAVGDRQAPEEYCATIEVNVYRHSATIRLALDFHQTPAAAQRHTLVHELLHCHFQPVENALSCVQTNLGDIWGVLDSVHHDSVEVAIDHLADIIAPFMPLPGEVEVTT